MPATLIINVIAEQKLVYKKIIDFLFVCVLQVILAAELLKSADELVKQKIHPTSVISGYRLACK